MTRELGDVYEWRDGWCVDLGNDNDGWGFDTRAEAEHFAIVYRGVVADREADERERWRVAVRAYFAACDGVPGSDAGAVRALHDMLEAP